MLISILNHLKDNYDLHITAFSAGTVSMVLSEMLVNRLENVAWSLGTALVVFTGLHYFKKWTKWS